MSPSRSRPDRRAPPAMNSRLDRPSPVRNAKPGNRRTRRWPGSGGYRHCVWGCCLAAATCVSSCARVGSRSESDGGLHLALSASDESKRPRPAVLLTGEGDNLHYCLDRWCLQGVVTGYTGRVMQIREGALTQSFQMVRGHILIHEEVPYVGPPNPIGNALIRR